MGAGLAAEADAAPAPEVDSMLPKSAPRREGMRDDRAILQEEQRRGLASWQQEGMRKLHEAALDPEKHFADMDLSYGSTREEGAAMLITESYLRLTNGGRTYRNPIGRDMARDRTAHEHFGGKGAGSDLEFGRQVIGREKRVEAERILLGDLQAEAALSELVRATDPARLDSKSFVLWREKARHTAGWRPARGRWRSRPRWRRRRGSRRPARA